MLEQFTRTENQLGKQGMEKLSRSRIAVFGIGGVGGYVVEALARSGVGAIDIIDNDKVCPSNINRQIIAITKTVGKLKVDVMEERIKEINPECVVTKSKRFFLPENSSEFDFSLYDYVVDAIDTITGKIEIIKKANEAGIPVISCMGTGNKLDPTAFKVADIYLTKVCPLAKVIRKVCRDNGIKALKVVYSQEKPLDTFEEKGERVPSSNSFVPSVAGLIIAGEVIKDITKVRGNGIDLS